MGNRPKHNNDPLPFTIRQVADLLHLTIRGSGDAVNIKADCPFCSPGNHKKGKMGLSQKGNCFNCVICGESGGMLALYAKVHNIGNGDAVREICELLHCGDTNAGDYSSAKTAAPGKYKETPRADAETIHQTYSMLLANLSLMSNHMEMLKSRGMTTANISAGGYRSVPPFGHEDICKALLKSGCTLEGVPGFFKDADGCWSIRLKAAGLIIPVRSISGKILALKVRLNKAFNGTRYIWCSSDGFPGGASSGSPIHFVGDPTAETVYLTEGPLKGNIASSLTERTFICVPGIRNLSRLPEMLESLKCLGVKKIIEVLDMDKHPSSKDHNPHVEAGQKEVIKILSNSGLEWQTAVWNPEHKGIDDYYWWRYQQRHEQTTLVDADYIA